MYRIHALQADHGDCLLIEYGDAQSPKWILVDGGTKRTYQALKPFLLKRGIKKLELLIVTHIDADHIDGVIELLSDISIGVDPEEVWFNGREHVVAKEGREAFGVEAGERLSKILARRSSIWNASFGGKAVSISESGALQPITLAGGMELTVLSPSRQRLQDLAKEWKKVCDEAAETTALPATPIKSGREAFSGGIDIDVLLDRHFDEDAAVANGSSIAVLAKFAGEVALLSGDAFPGDLLESLKRLPAPLTLPISLFKVPHHGSKGNTSEELVRALPAKRYLVSSNGSRFKHPDAEAIARIIAPKSSPELLFNYESEWTIPWRATNLQREYAYSTRYASHEPLPIDIAP